MKRIVRIAEEQDLTDFAKRAALAFQDNPAQYSYSEAVDRPGEGTDLHAEDLLALRWNSMSVLVCRLSDFEPRLYPVHQFIKGALPKAENE
jgi:hypothetical protein